MHSGVVDRVRQPIHPVGNTTITEKSSVRPQEQYRDVKPLTVSADKEPISFPKIPGSKGCNRRRAGISEINTDVCVSRTLQTRTDRYQTLHCVDSFNVNITVPMAMYPNKLLSRVRSLSTLEA